VLGQDVTDWERDRARLERQNERLEALATAVSHDLGSPLEAVERNLDLAGEACDSAALERAGRSLDRVRELVDDLRLLVRDGDPAGTTGPVDLGALAERCWADVDAPGGRLVVRTDLTVRADETRLARVLRNLLENAATHGGDEVTVTVGGLPDRPGFFVEDDGPGIAPDRREMVFEAGYSTDPDGTGFGLTVVRELVRAHGWTVRATGRPAGGARFEVAGVEPA
jgi:signal transduction histidine kinase